MPRRRLLTLLAVPALAGGLLFGVGAAPAAAAPAPIPNPIGFVDTFNNGRLDGWALRSLATHDGPSNWHVSRQELVQSSNAYGGSSTSTAPAMSGTMLVTGSQSWRNYDYTVRARTTDNDAFGVLFRYQGPNDFYRFSMDAQRHYRRLVKRVNGRYTLVAQSRVGYTPGAWYTIRVVASGTHLQVYLNGSAIFDVHDSSLTYGRIGVYTWGCPTAFDNVSAQVEDDDYVTLALLPDTQYESRDRPSMLAAQTTWLAANRASLHLAAVLHEGDVVDNEKSATQWSYAAKYLSYLSGKVPFVIAPGNHDTFDYSTHTAPYPVDIRPFNDFIGRLPNYYVSGRFQSDSSMNTYRLLDAGGLHLLVIEVQFGARDDVLTWAGRVADRYPDRHVIMLTHDYLGYNSQLRGQPGDKYLPGTYNMTLNDGVDIWAKFVKLHPNVQFTFNGHDITATSPYEWSAGRLVSTDDAGRSVYQMLANYQMYGEGNGYLRLVRLYPATGTVKVFTYSPATKRYLTDPADQFSYTGVDLGAWNAN